MSRDFRQEERVGKPQERRSPPGNAPKQLGLKSQIFTLELPEIFTL
ncbi:MAG: hypothetical protein WBL95_16835 [Microcoleus sp.]